MSTQAMRPPRRAVIIATSAIALLAIGCGDDPKPVVESGALTSTTGMADDDHVEEEGEEHASFAFGEPADPADATETVKVAMLDSFEYTPPTITISADETVLFEVTNEGRITHEFVLGDHAFQLDHEQEMSEMDGAMMHDEPNAISIAPGETKELAFRFTDVGELEYACHEPGHYDAGMIGGLVVQ